MIETPRLLLLPATLETLRAELESPGALAAVARMEVPGTWPPELVDRDPILFTIRRLEAAPEEAEWWLHYFVLRSGDGAPGVAIGCGGYKGPPQPDGLVEIGYSILPEYRRRGLALEAVRGMVERAFSDPRVTAVVAETLPELASSIGVLEKAGFSFAGPGSEDGVIRYRLVTPSAPPPAPS